MIWGEIKGSGPSPYRTVADRSGPASKCSCPSRKFPCKHALGPMLVEAASPHALKEADQPEWVASWAKGRATRAASAETKADVPQKPVDEKAQAKRRQARDDKVAAALDELDLWLRDLMRRSLASVRTEPYAFWDRMAGRLVDGQAPFPRPPRSRPARFAGCRAASRCAEARGGLGSRDRQDRADPARRPPPRRSDPRAASGIRAAIGVPVSAEELTARPGQTNQWAVLAHTIEEDDKLTARSVWLVGRQSGSLAQILDYGTSGSPLPPAPAAGQDFSGDIAFYPGDPPLRAIFRDGKSAASPAGPQPRHARPGSIAGHCGFRKCGSGSPPMGKIGGSCIGDATGSLALLVEPRIRALVSTSGGRTVDLFGLYDGYAFNPLALSVEGRIYVTPAQDPRPFPRRVV